MKLLASSYIGTEKIDVLIWPSFFSRDNETGITYLVTFRQVVTCVDLQDKTRVFVQKGQFVYFPNDEDNSYLKLFSQNAIYL